MHDDWPVGLCCFDRDLRYREINKWLAALNGLSVEEHLGRSVMELFPELAAGIVPQLRRVLETGESVLAGLVIAETPAEPSVERQFRHNYVPVKSDDGGIVGVSCAVVEITEQERAELRKLTSRQREVLRLLAEGHSLKTVAGMLHITRRTVTDHRDRMMKRLGLKTIVALLQFARGFG